VTVTLLYGAKRRRFGPTWPEEKRVWAASPTSVFSSAYALELLAVFISNSFCSILAMYSSFKQFHDNPIFVITTISYAR
jgi:hypothetical protein